MRWVVVLAGGVGSRFWPVSTAERPKQLLALAGDRPLVVDAVARLLPLVPVERVLLVGSLPVQAALRRALPDVPAGNVLAEPFAASTAPALAWATARARAADPGATVLSVHADWTVGDPEGFRAAAAAALDLAEREDVLVTVGARATRPEIGYGYIVPGERIGPGPARRIARFVEKPGAAAAQALIAGGALWNTGMFAWTAARFRSECERLARELAGGLPALDRGEIEAFYRAVRPVSVDVGLYERTERGAVLAGDFAWDDVGSWAALPKVRGVDAAGNTVAGTTLVIDGTNNIVLSDDATLIATVGVSDLIVVKSGDAILVIHKDQAQDVRKVIEALSARNLARYL